MKKRLLSMALVLCMCLSLLPAAAFAADEPSKLITEVAVTGFTKPVAGATPDFELSIPAGVPYHIASKQEIDDHFGDADAAINGIWWDGPDGYMSATDTFVEGEEYRMEVVLFANEGYQLAEKQDLIVTLNGDSGLVNGIDTTANYCLQVFTNFNEAEPPAPTEADVIFQVENGTWADNTSDPMTVVVPLIDGRGTLSEEQIPTGMKPAADYEGGAWDSTPYTAEGGITGDVVYTYTFTRHVHAGVRVEGQAPTCTAEGWNDYYKCNCGRFFEDQACSKEITNLDAWKTGDGKLEKLPHSYGDWTVVTPATETEEGIEKRVCSVCGHEETRAIPKLEHVHTMEYHTEEPATCTQPGVQEHWHCTGCGKDFADEAGTKELTDLVIPAVGHTFDEEWHNNEDNHWHECTCGEKSEVGAHTYGEWSVTKEPTVDTAGERSRSCTVCGHTQTEQLDPLPTEPVDPEPTEPTEPVDPEPTEPTEPVDPEPTDPTEPVDPEPTEPTEPVDPEPTEPVEQEPIQNPFTDVQETDYFYDSVLWAVGSGVTSGTTETTFSPEQICTRAEAVTFLWSAAGKPEPKSTANPFRDVPADAYYLQAALWAAENGITAGTGNDCFNPDMVCSRGQIVTFLWAAEGKPEAKTETNPFVDLAPDAFYQEAVLWAVENGITAGSGDNRFSPERACTRAEIVTFLWKAENISEK